MSIKRIEAHQTWELRQRVMWPDKDISHVKLQDDALGLHYGLFADDRLISVISLFFTDGIVQFRKFATDCEQQHQGYGTRLLSYAIEQAVQRKARQIWCHARKDAVPFYARFGLAETGEPFKRDGKEYIRMTRQLPERD